MAGQDLHRIYRQALESHGLKPVADAVQPCAYWEAPFFQVEKSQIFGDFDAHQKKDFLTQMSTHILQEACAIERAGIDYAARMILMTDDIDEKGLYSLIGSEETLHLKSLEPFLVPGQRHETPDFAQLIGHWIAKLERPNLLLLVQILLEGWGVTYYQSLLQNSMNVDLAAVFKKILQDESRHHASGIVIFRQEKLEKSQRSQLEQELTVLFDCLQIGPQRVAIGLAQASKLPSVDFQRLFLQLNAVQDTQQKLERMKKLLEKSQDAELIKTCNDLDVFTAHSVEKMAALADRQYQEILKNQWPLKDSRSELSL